MTREQEGRRIVDEEMATCRDRIFEILLTRGASLEEAAAVEPLLLERVTAHGDHMLREFLSRDGD